MIYKNDNVVKNKQLDRIVDYGEGWKQITIGDQRFYKKADVYYPSVTYILSYYPKGKYFESYLKDKGNEADEIAAFAADKGTTVHKAIDKMLEGFEPIWINEETGVANYSLEEWRMIIRFADFWNTVKPKLIQSEYHIFSNEYVYAGTIDLVVEIDNELWILDTKTSNAIHRTYELQVASYAVAWNEHHDRKIDKTGVLWLKSKTQKTSKDRMQGSGWQVKTFDQTYMESFEYFKKVQDIFKLENPDPEPISNRYPNKIKLNIE
jgi:hypothetical protein